MPDWAIWIVIAVVALAVEATTTAFFTVYFGVAGIRNTRHTLIPCLAADVVGALSAVWATRWLLG